MTSLCNIRLHKYPDPLGNPKQMGIKVVRFKDYAMTKERYDRSVGSLILDRLGFKDIGIRLNRGVMEPTLSAYGLGSYGRLASLRVYPCFCIVEHAHPGAVFSPFRRMPRVLHRAIDPFWMRHHDCDAAIF